MIYLIYGMPGPLRQFMTELLTKYYNVNNTHINNQTNTLGGQNSEYTYTDDGETLAIDIDAINNSVDSELDHYVICSDIDIIRKLICRYYHKVKVLHLVFNDYEKVLNLLSTTKTESSAVCCINNTLERRQAINALVDRLDESNIDNYTKINIESIPSDITSLYKLVKQKTELFFNNQYYNWSLLLNGARMSLPTSVGFDLDQLFAEDYSRVINSSAFRRLQGKAQIFPLEKHDYIRTRLTHAIECASVAEEIGIKILDEFEKQDHIKVYGSNPICKHIPVLLKTSATLHDMGDPPFGHFGARGIQEWFRNEENKAKIFSRVNIPRPATKSSYELDLEHFDGNAQLIRLMSKLSTYKYGYGLDLTFATFATSLKYPVSLKEDDASDTISYFESEVDIFNSIRDNVGLRKYSRHPLTNLLEAADDIAYLSSDLQDSFRKKIISLYDIINSFESVSTEGCEDIKSTVLNKFSELINQYSRNSREDKVCIVADFHRFIRERLVTASVQSFIDNYDQIMRGEFSSTILGSNNSSNYICTVIRTILEKYVYNDDEVIMNQIKSASIINKLLDTFVDTVLTIDDTKEVNKDSFHGRLFSILPDNYKNICREANALIYNSSTSEEEALMLITYNKILLVTDFISGMTDSYAKEIYDLIVANE